MALFDRTNPVWIGVNIDEEGRWVWVDGQSLHPGQRDNFLEDERCGVASL